MGLLSKAFKKIKSVTRDGGILGKAFSPLKKFNNKIFDKSKDVFNKAWDNKYIRGAIIAVAIVYGGFLIATAMAPTAAGAAANGAAVYSVAGTGTGAATGAAAATGTGAATGAAAATGTGVGAGATSGGLLSSIGTGLGKAASAAGTGLGKVGAFMGTEGGAAAITAGGYALKGHADGKAAEKEMKRTEGLRNNHASVRYDGVMPEPQHLGYEGPSEEGLLSQGGQQPVRPQLPEEQLPYYMREKRNA